MIKLSVYTPEKPLIVEQKVQEIRVPSVQGELGLLPQHAPVISLLQAGVLRYLPEGASQWEKVAVGWGYLEVSGEEVKILAESAKTKKMRDQVELEKTLKNLQAQLERWDIDPSQREKLEREKLRIQGELDL